MQPGDIAFPPSPATGRQRSDWHTDLRRTLATLAALLVWDGLGQDLALARVFGSAHGFALRGNWLLEQWLHDGARCLAWALLLYLVFALFWPPGFLRRAGLGARVQIVVSVLLALALVNLAKWLSLTSCPWDLAQFGGLARQVSHWAVGVADGGGGRCFPAGHAASGFAFVGGYFALRAAAPRAARRWLAAALCAGFVLGGAQQARGAHFMSHTLWTGWLCWASGWLCELGARALRLRCGFGEAGARCMACAPAAQAGDRKVRHATTAPAPLPCVAASAAPRPEFRWRRRFSAYWSRPVRPWVRRR